MDNRGHLILLGLIFITITGVGALDTASLSPGERVVESAEVAQTDVIDECAADPPADFSEPAGGTNETIGWVDGYWYDEPLDINTTGGLSPADLESLSARTAARFEAMRCLTATDGVPPIEILTREEFQERTAGSFDDTETDFTRFDNAKLETLLLSSSSTSSIAQRQEQHGSTVQGTYNFRRNEITIVTEDTTSLLIDESVLAHEIGHAIQDQNFDLSRYDRATVDRDKGKLGLIEGDVHLIEKRYLEACDSAQWSQPCITEEFGEGGTESGEEATESAPREPPNWGLYFKNFQPYSDGPNFVQHSYESGDGWESVDELYENPPRSAITTAKPDTYGKMTLPELDIPDQSSDEYERITFDHRPDFDTIGIAGITGMFAVPTYEPGSRLIFHPDNLLNVLDDGSLNTFNPINYLQPETEGWRADKLYTYKHVETNETGTVWELHWNDSIAAEPFVESYQHLIEYRGGHASPIDEQTYTFPADSAYEMAVTIDQDDDRVTIVTAPTVADLSEIHHIG